MNLQETIRRIILEELHNKDKKIVCQECGWSWNLSEGGHDPYTCHKCGHENHKSELQEKCWAGYTQKGMKTMFGKRYPNCVKKTKKSNFKGINRIILIGPPTVGKSTVAEELSNQLGIEYVKLDKLQEEFGYGEGKEFKLVKYVLSPNFEKYNTPSILDFGGGHVYNQGVKDLLNDYPNVFLLLPSKDSEKSNELLRKGNEERWSGFMDQIIQGLRSGKHKHSKEKELELIDKLERMKKGEGGKFDKEDLPDTEEMKGWGGLDMDKDWNKFVPLSKEEDVKNRDIAKHIVSVYDDNGKRRDKRDITKDIINLL